jgi:UDP-N-acetylglucosamine--N-acetylmuramyl-(pentapeptide) pyrophosphoryl-undecaprenol N-acetylglucosamine transferase
LYPGLAVAEALRAQAALTNRNLDIVWAATPRSVDQRLLSEFGENYIRQPVQPLVKSIKKIWPFLQGWRKSCRHWESEFSKHRTDCVVALGGYAAGPAAYVAAKRKIPVILLNPDALPGLANRFLLKRSDVIITQWPLAESYTKTIKGAVKALGCPIRPQLVVRTREEAGKMLGLDPRKKTLVITGASLGAKTINDAFLAMLSDINMRSAFQANGAGWQIVHLAGIEQADAVQSAYAKMPEVQARVIGYCDDMASIWAIADLTIARAGASTCAELTACGVPSILLPYPFHKDMHQKANAMELMNAGAATIVDDVKDAEQNAIAIKKALHTLVYDDGLRKEMARAAREAGKPAAADQIAGEILSRISSTTR